MPVRRRFPQLLPLSLLLALACREKPVTPLQPPANEPPTLEKRLFSLVQEQRFAEAEALASAAIAENPREVVAWAALGDSALSLGDYETAARAFQAMIDLRPDSFSYRRGAKIHWLQGDSDGAVELMRKAIEKSDGHDKLQRAAYHVELGDLFFDRGQYELARGEYELSLHELPENARGLFARGRLALAAPEKPAFSDALRDLSASLKAAPSTATRALYIDILEAAGQKQEAERETATLYAEGPRDDPRATVLFLATHKQKLDLALRLAEEQVQKRPDIFAYDALAWAAYANGQPALAWESAEQATRLGTKDARLHFHLGMIALLRGDKQRAAEALTQALSESPRWDLRDAVTAREALLRLGPTP